jgi:hypothetical protein
MKYKSALIFIALMILLFPYSAFAADADNYYPYTGEKFGILLDDSYNIYKLADRNEFYAWMNQGYEHSKYRFPGKENLSLLALLNELEANMQSLSDPSLKLEEELKILVWMHKFTKTVIPKFSLVRGFEFFNVVKFGERQCLLQSVLMTALLQDMHINAGVVMVYKNPEGKESNNGHAVVLVKLSNSRDIMLDASHKEPFALHLGIFARNSQDYIYLEPVFEPEAFTISSYKTASGNGIIDSGKIRQLDFNFVRSQTFYYRGEHTQGGLIEKPVSKKGLITAAGYLQRSVQLCPKNPLAVYMLAKVYQALGETGKAAALYNEAYQLYAQFGWIPQRVKESQDSVNKGN